MQRVASELTNYRTNLLTPLIPQRDVHLKPGGALYPSHATLFIAPLSSPLFARKSAELESEIDNWDEFKGISAISRLDLGLISA